MVQISSIADVWFEDTGIKQNVFVAQNVYDVVPYIIIHFPTKYYEITWRTIKTIVSTLCEVFSSIASQFIFTQNA